MAEIDRARFAEEVTLLHAVGGRSMREVAAANPGLNIATISRAARGDSDLTPGNYLAVCRAYRLDPWDFYLAVTSSPRVTRKTILKRMEKQSVTRSVSHETQEAAR